MSETSERVRVAIALPLPLDVAGTLINIIGAAYPSAALSTVAGRSLEMFIDSDDRVGEGADWSEIVAESKVLVEFAEAQAEGFRDGRLEVSAPEWLSRLLVPFAQAAITSDPAIVNYLSWQCFDKDGTEFVLSVAKSSGQTPHAMHQAAEAKAAAYAKRLREAGIDPDEIHP